MIKKQKKQLSKLYFLLIACLILPLAGFFFYATQYQTTFFAFISCALFIIVTFLLFLHRRLSNKQSRINLEKEEFFEKANLLRSEIEHEWGVIHALHQKIEGYGDLKSVVERLSQSLNLNETAETLIKETAAVFDRADVMIILYLLDDETGKLGIAFAQQDGVQVSLKSKSGDLFDHWILKNQQPLFVDDAKRDFRFDIDQMDDAQNHSIRSLISVPLSIGDRVLGILRLDSPSARKFTNDDLRFLRTIGDLGSIAMENARLYQQIENLATKDGLTGLYLRRYLMSKLEKEIPRETRSREELSFLMIDIDHFKKYNDEFGHMAGDIVLKTMGALLSDHFAGPGNVVSRYGGEEFAVLLPHCKKEDAYRRAEEFRSKVEKEEIVLRRQKTSITISVGVAAFPQDATLKNELIQQADDALYKAKEEGRNRVIKAS